MTDIYKWLFGARGRSAVSSPLPPLPELLQPYSMAIGATARPIIAATVIDGPPPNGKSCQLGGQPWWPKGRRYPRARDGAPLHLLMQINFAELPALAPFPETGLLQLFIAAGDLYGANLDDPSAPSGFACIYHEDLRGAVAPVTAGRKSRVDTTLPLETADVPLALTFALDQMVCDITDYRFDALLPAIAADEELLAAYAEWTSDEAAVSAIRLGGYPTFTQQDPRAFPAHSRLGDTSLLTIDTTSGIMWGDCGAAQFLMDAGDLERRDFSRVAYNWDCC